MYMVVMEILCLLCCYCRKSMKERTVFLYNLGTRHWVKFCRWESQANSIFTATIHLLTGGSCNLIVGGVYTTSGQYFFSQDPACSTVQSSIARLREYFSCKYHVQLPMICTTLKTCSVNFDSSYRQFQRIPSGGFENLIPY